LDSIWTSSTISTKGTAIQSTMAAPAPRRSARPNVHQSYKNTCGAPAPQATLRKNLVPPIRNTITQKVIPKSSVVPKGGSLVFINSGHRLDQGSVRCLIIILIIYLLMRGFSGAATVSTVEQSFCAHHVITFQFARNALTSEVKRAHFNAHIAF